MRYRVTSLVLYFDEENNVISSCDTTYNFKNEKRAREFYNTQKDIHIEVHSIDPDNCEWKVSLYDDDKDDYIAYTKSRHYGHFV